MNSDTDTDTAEALPFELVDPILILAARLIRPTTPHTRRLPALDAAAASAAELALTNVLLVIHPSPDLCSTLLPRLSWFTPNRTLKSSDLRFVDTWARSKSVVPFVFDIPLALATLCFARAAPAHVLDWLARLLSLAEVVSDKSISKLFDIAAEVADDDDGHALRALQWWAGRVPIEKDGHAARVKQAVREAARAAELRVLDWLWSLVPVARFDCVLDGATNKEARDPKKVVEWWVQRYKQSESASESSTSLEQWMRRGQQTITVAVGDTFIDSISARGCIPVLEWWRYSPLDVRESQLKYTHRAIDSASEAGKLDVLKWWQSAAAESAGGLEVKYSELAMDKAASPVVLDWWLHESKLPLKFTSFATTHAARTNSRDILDWWLAHAAQLEFTFSPTTLHDTMELVLLGNTYNRQGMEKWVTLIWFAKHWRETGQVISQGYLLRASVDPNKAWFLQWWSEHGLPVERVVHEANRYACWKQWWEIVAWWNKQAKEIRESKGQGTRIEGEEKHPAVVRHERECMEMLQAMLKEMDPDTVSVSASVSAGVS